MPRAASWSRSAVGEGERAVGSTSGGSEGAAPKPGRSSAITSRSRASSGTTGSQTDFEAPSPWIRSSGSRAVAPSRRAGRRRAHRQLGFAKSTWTSPIRRSRKPASEELR